MNFIFGILAYLFVGIVLTSLWRRFTDSNDADAPEALLFFVFLWPLMVAAFVSYHSVIYFSNFLQRWPKRSTE